jgi:antitoxin HicB
MVRFNYPVKLTKQAEGGYLVEFPDLPEAITQGETINDALEAASDCLEEAIANRIEMKLDIPISKNKSYEKYSVSLHITMAAKAALFLAMKEKNITNVSLAKKLNCDEKEVRRLIDPHYPSKVPNIEYALNRLGKHLEICVTDS